MIGVVFGLLILGYVAYTLSLRRAEVERMDDGGLKVDIRALKWDKSRNLYMIPGEGYLLEGYTAYVKKTLMEGRKVSFIFVERSVPGGEDTYFGIVQTISR